MTISFVIYQAILNPPPLPLEAGQLITARPGLGSPSHSIDMLPSPIK